MGRSFEEIRNEIIQVKESKPGLDKLTSKSAVAIWRLMIDVFSMAAFILEGLWDIAKAELLSISDRAKIGTLPWYRQLAFDYQYGYEQQFIGNRFIYSKVDETAKIIKYAAVSEVENAGKLKVLIKVATQANGVPVKLTDDQLNSFRRYIKENGIAAVNVLAQSNDPDLLKYDIEVYYNPLIDFDTLKNNVEQACAVYISSLNFVGDFLSSRFTDEIQKVNGVEDVLIIALKARPATGSYVDITRKYTTFAGYMKITGGNKLSIIEEISPGIKQTSNAEGVTIKYIANV